MTVDSLHYIKSVIASDNPYELTILCDTSWEGEVFEVPATVVYQGREYMVTGIDVGQSTQLKTLPLFVPSLTYKGMDVGNGLQAYIAYINFDSDQPTFNTLRTKADRREALKRYCQQDTWAIVEILRAVRRKIK